MSFTADDNQSKAYKIEAGKPRLKGMTWPSVPDPWTLRCSGDTAEWVVNSRAFTGAMKSMIVMAVVVPPAWAALFVWQKPADQQSPWWYLLAIPIAIAILLGAGLFQSQFKREADAGPLVRCGPTGDVEFPRFQRTVARADAVRWVIVHGNQAWELQLVFRQPDGEMSQPVAGCDCRRVVEKLARELSEVTGVPLSPPPEPRNWWRNPFAPAARVPPPPSSDSGSGPG
ncbi:MAG: hypothetical protein NTW19_06805 [Planctomycetota bacterium]|nr:hypothetical protein [Planctomycetota bacterium]